MVPEPSLDACVVGRCRANISNILAHSVNIWTGMFLRERSQIEPSDQSQRLPWTFLGWHMMVGTFACSRYCLTSNTFQCYSICRLMVEKTVALRMTEYAMAFSLLETDGRFDQCS
eukprot:sb/3476732/